MSNKSFQVAVDVDNMNSVNDRCDESNCVSWGLKTVYPLIVVSTIAVFVCLLLILALLIPLFLNLKKKMKHTRDEIANKSTRTRSTTRTNSNTSVNTRQQDTSVPSYGSYDLYLVYLAIPDLILNITVLILCGCIVNQEVHNVNYIYAIVMGCSTANLYINCFVSYEILNLLRNSNNVTKSRPPSLMKVTIQSMVVYVFSIIIFVAYYFTRKAKIESYYIGDYERYDFLWKVHMSCMIIVGTIPIMYFCYVWITIWYQGYMKLSSVTAGMKELIWYFFRIFVVFNSIWLPGMILGVIGGSHVWKYANLAKVGLLFCGIQPIVSFCFAMMKLDVRNYTINLLTLSYIRKAQESTPTATDDELEIAC